MNKKLLVTLVAALLLVSAASCGRNSGNTNDTTGEESGSRNPAESYIVVPGTDADGNEVTRIEYITNEPANPGFDPSEENPTFTDCTKQVVVFTAVATVRTSTMVADNNAVGWPSEGRLLDVTGESQNWYRINYTVGGKTQTCYIAKTVAADASALEGFTTVNEEVIIATTAVNVRSYPSSESDLSIRGSLTKGAKVTRVGVSDKWSRILYEVTSETETDAEGNPKKEIMQYYISNDCIEATEAATTEAATTEAATTENKQ